MDEQRRIRLLLAGDSATVEEVRRWIRLAFGRLASLYVDDLEDLEQEVLIELYAGLESQRFRGDSSLRTYVRAYAYHKILDHRRARGRRQMVDIGDLGLADQGPSAYDQLRRSQKLSMALEIMEEMPESCRELWWRVQRGQSFREISLALGVAEGTLRVRLLRCRQKALDLRRARLDEAGEMGESEESEPS